jgi:hypothetical protein
VLRTAKPVCLHGLLSSNVRPHDPRPTASAGRFVLIMKSKILAVLGSSLTAVITLQVVDRIGCVVRGGCVEDDASVRALAMLGVPLVFLYVVGSWVLVYPVALALRKRMPVLLACLLTSLLFGVACGLVIHRSEVDGSVFNTLLAVVPWLSTSWFLGALVALRAWPTPGAYQASAAAQ